MQESRAALVIFIKKLLDDRGTNMRAVSKKLGLNDAYLQQFLTRGTPEVLPEDVRHGLAALLRVDEIQFKIASKKSDPPEELIEDNSAAMGNDPSVRNRTIGQREVGHMSGESMNEAILKDLIKRLSRVEDKVFGNEEAPRSASDPPGRRKA